MFRQSTETQSQQRLTGAIDRLANSFGVQYVAGLKGCAAREIGRARSLGYPNSQAFIDKQFRCSSTNGAITENHNLRTHGPSPSENLFGWEITQPIA